jgi:hypothetical protein
MTTYFFDFRYGGAAAIDDVGRELADVEAAHAEAVDALARLVEEMTEQGRDDQWISVEVRDGIGPVVELSAVVRSRIIRKQ